MLQCLYSDYIKNNKFAKIGEGVVIKNSKIKNAGYGLFADRDFKRGEIITGVDGDIISFQEAKKREFTKRSHMRTLLYHNLVLDGLRVPCRGKGGGSFANDGLHVSQNNAKFHNVYFANKLLPVCFLRAIKNIKKNEEILVSYGRQYWRLHGKKKRN